MPGRATPVDSLAEHPLRVGLSMDAEVDVSRRDGKMLADGTAAPAAASTPVYSALERGADAELLHRRVQLPLALRVPAGGGVHDGVSVDRAADRVGGGVAERKGFTTEGTEDTERAK